MTDRLVSPIPKVKEETDVTVRTLNRCQIGWLSRKVKRCSPTETEKHRLFFMA